MLAYSCQNKLKILAESDLRLLETINTGDHVKCFEISPDSSIVLVQTLSRRLKMYDLISFELLKDIELNCYIIKITDDGSKFLTSDYGGVIIWDLKSMTHIKSIRETNSSNKHFCMNHDASLVISFFGNDNDVKVKVINTMTDEFYFVDIDFGSEERQPSFHGYISYDNILLTPDQSTLLIVSYKTIKIYDIKENYCFNTIRCESEICSVSFMDDGNDILISCYRTLKMYNVITDDVREFPEFSDYFGRNFSLNSEETRITFIVGKTIYIFDLINSCLISEKELEDVGYLTYIVKYVPSITGTYI